VHIDQLPVAVPVVSCQLQLLVTLSMSSGSPSLRDLPHTRANLSCVGFLHIFCDVFVNLD
jgi:hypothetical protein